MKQSAPKILGKTFSPRIFRADDTSCIRESENVTHPTGQHRGPLNNPHWCHLWRAATLSPAAAPARLLQPVARRRLSAVTAVQANAVPTPRSAPSNVRCHCRGGGCHSMRCMGLGIRSRWHRRALKTTGRTRSNLVVAATTRLGGQSRVENPGLWYDTGGRKF